MVCEVMLKLSVCCRGGYPSIYTRSKGGALAILGVKPRAALPQHGGMPPPEQGVAEERGQGVGRPLTVPPRHCHHVVGSRLGLDQPLVVLCPIWIELVGISLVSLRKSALESAFQ